MEANEPIVELSVDDMTKVPSMRYKDFAALFNPFVTHTVKFLNRFACVCEEKLADLSLKIQQLEVTITLLETKLSSIPGLEDVKVESQTTNSQQQQPETETNAAAPQTTQYVVPDEVEEEEPEPEAPAVKKVSEDPRYAKYFKMIKMGVPLGALKQKVLADGLNPDLLEDPDAPAPDGGVAVDDDDSDSEGSSASSFSDDD